MTVARAPKPKCATPIKAYHRETGLVRMLPCRRRMCVTCGPAYWRPSKLAALHAGLGQGDFLALLLTAPSDATVLWNEGAANRWHRFFHRMRRAYPGAKLEFWRVGELQERGVVHYHVVMRGLAYLSIEQFRKDAVAAGFGPWVGVKRPRDYKGGTHSLGWYFGKYLLKDYQGASVGRLVTMSLGWKVNWIRRERQTPGQWIVMFGSWARWGERYGRVDPVRARAASAGGPAWDPPWWGHSWQWHRKREERPIDSPWTSDIVRG